MQQQYVCKSFPIEEGCVLSFLALALLSSSTLHFPTTKTQSILSIVSFHMHTRKMKESKTGRQQVQIHQKTESRKPLGLRDSGYLCSAPFGQLGHRGPLKNDLPLPCALLRPRVALPVYIRQPEVRGRPQTSLCFISFSPRFGPSWPSPPPAYQ